MVPRARRGFSSNPFYGRPLHEVVAIFQNAKRVRERVGYPSATRRRPCLLRACRRLVVVHGWCCLRLQAWWRHRGRGAPLASRTAPSPSSSSFSSMTRSQVLWLSIVVLLVLFGGGERRRLVFVEVRALWPRVWFCFPFSLYLFYVPISGRAKWKIGSGRTPSVGTGPSRAHGGSKYYFLEVSGSRNGDYVRCGILRPHHTSISSTQHTRAHEPPRHYRVAAQCTRSRVGGPLSLSLSTAATCDSRCYPSPPPRPPQSSLPFRPPPVA